MRVCMRLLKLDSLLRHAAGLLTQASAEGVQAVQDAIVSAAVQGDMWPNFLNWHAGRITPFMQVCFGV